MNKKAVYKILFWLFITGALVMGTIVLLLAALVGRMFSRELAAPWVFFAGFFAGACVFYALHDSQKKKKVVWKRKSREEKRYRLILEIAFIGFIITGLIAVSVWSQGAEAWIIPFIFFLACAGVSVLFWVLCFREKRKRVRQSKLEQEFDLAWQTDSDKPLS